MSTLSIFDELPHDHIESIMCFLECFERKRFMYTCKKALLLQCPKTITNCDIRYSKTGSPPNALCWQGRKTHPNRLLSSCKLSFNMILFDFSTCWSLKPVVEQRELGTVFLEQEVAHITELKVTLHDHSRGVYEPWQLDLLYTELRYFASVEKLTIRNQMSMSGETENGTRELGIISSVVKRYLPKLSELTMNIKCDGETEDSKIELPLSVENLKFVTDHYHTFNKAAVKRILTALAEDNERRTKTCHFVFVRGFWTVEPELHFCYDHECHELAAGLAAVPSDMTVVLDGGVIKTHGFSQEQLRERLVHITRVARCMVVVQNVMNVDKMQHDHNYNVLDIDASSFTKIVVDKSTMLQ